MLDSDLGAMKNKIAQLRRLVADLRGELGEVLTCQNDMERSFGERLDRHREDLDWDREECILLRAGLQDVRIMRSLPSFFLNFSLFITRPPVLSTMLNCIIMPHNYYDNMWHVPMVKIPCIGYNL